MSRAVVSQRAAIVLVRKDENVVEYVWPRDGSITRERGGSFVDRVSRVERMLGHGPWKCDRWGWEYRPGFARR